MIPFLRQTIAMTLKQLYIYITIEQHHFLNYAFNLPNNDYTLEFVPVCQSV